MLRTRFWSNVEKTATCWLWRGYADDRGYGRYGSGQQVLAHRLAYADRFGSFDLAMCVCHRCDTPACVNPDHLFLGTYADNNHDRDRKGRHTPLRGEANPRTTLTPDLVRRIRSMRADGRSFNGIAADLAVGRSAVCAVVYRKSWMHLP